MKPTQEQVIAWAREASKGMLSYDAEGEWYLNQSEVEVAVALAYEAGRKNENEACEKAIKDVDDYQSRVYPECIQAIRARREQ